MTARPLERPAVPPAGSVRWPAVFLPRPGGQTGRGHPDGRFRALDRREPAIEPPPLAPVVRWTQGGPGAPGRERRPRGAPGLGDRLHHRLPHQSLGYLTPAEHLASAGVDV